MNRLQLEHVIRAAAGNADALDIVVIGSQSILGAYPEAPKELLESMEVDVFPLQRAEDAILIDGAMGERSVFHETFGYYAHGVGEDTAILPEGWRLRLVPVCNENTRGATGWCLEPHDLAVSKLLAGREKDLEFVQVLLSFGMVDAAIVKERIGMVLGLTSDAVALAQTRLNRLSSPSG